MDSGCQAVDAFTNRPVVALRFIDRLLLVPRPTRSVVVRLGHREAAAPLTNRPVLALRERVGDEQDLELSPPDTRAFGNAPGECMDELDGWDLGLRDCPVDGIAVDLPPEIDGVPSDAAE